jgi:hypothetical protein
MFRLGTMEVIASLHYLPCTYLILLHLQAVRADSYQSVGMTGRPVRYVSIHLLIRNDNLISRFTGCATIRALIEYTRRLSLAK